MGELESAIERRVVRWAEKQDIIVWKLNVIGRRGLPDRMFILPPGSSHSIIFIEFKRRGEKARKLQEWIHNRLRERGVPCLTTDNAHEAIEFICEQSGGVVTA